MTCSSPRATSLPPGSRARNSSNNNDAVRPWTAARCQRLLRQLESRLASLRRLVQSARDEGAMRPSQRTKTQLQEHCAPKRTRYTYAQRRQLPTTASSSSSKAPTGESTPIRTVRPLGAIKFAQTSPTVGRVDFPTPVLRKLGQDQSATPQQQSTALPTNDELKQPLPAKLVDQLHALRRLSPEGHYRIYESIFSWLDDLLRCTTSQSQASQPKSLMAMCLRRIPACIAGIESWERQMSGANGFTPLWKSPQASHDIYGQLEAFGAAGSGWEPLSLVVRAHATSIISNAVGDGVLEPGFVGLLLQLCVHHQCSTEAASLVLHTPGAFLAPHGLSSTLTESNRLGPLGSLVGSLGGRNAPGPLFSCLSQLIQGGKLPISCFSTRGFRAAWISCLEALTMSRHQPCPADLMSTALEHLALSQRHGQLARNCEREQTLVSLAAGVAAAAVALSSKSRATSTGLDQGRVLRRLMYVLNRALAEVGSRRGTAKPTAQDGGQFMLAMACYLATAMGGAAAAGMQRDAAEECGGLVAHGNQSALRSQYRQALLLACTVAHDAGRACAVPCHNVLSEICSKLERISFPDWFRRGLQTDGALVLAQKSKDLRDVAFAEQLPARAQHGGMFAGWRWEDGISEWVVDSRAETTMTTEGKMRRRSRHRSSGNGHVSLEVHVSGQIDGGVSGFSFSGGRPGRSGEGRGGLAATPDELLHDPQQRIMDGSTPAARIIRGCRRFGTFGRGSGNALAADDWDELL